MKIGSTLKSFKIAQQRAYLSYIIKYRIIIFAGTKSRLFAALPINRHLTNFDEIFFVVGVKK